MKGEMKREFAMQKGNVYGITVVFDASWSITLKLNDFRDNMDLPFNLGVIQKSLPFYTAPVLTKVLSIWWLTCDLADDLIYPMYSKTYTVSSNFGALNRKREINKVRKRVKKKKGKL